MLNEALDKIKANGLCTNIMVITNILVFIILEIGGSTLDTKYMLANGADFPPLVLDGGEYYRIFTSMFMYFGVTHLFNNMLVLFFLGDYLEKILGKTKFIIVYIGSGLIGGLMSCIYNYITGSLAVSAGASGAVFGVIGSLLYIVILNRGKIAHMTTGKLGFFILFSIYHGMSESGIDNMAHIAGVIGGILLTVILYRREKAPCCFDDDIIQ